MHYFPYPPSAKKWTLNLRDLRQGMKQPWFFDSYRCFDKQSDEDGWL